MDAIVSGTPFQIGCVVEDLDRAEQIHAEFFGVQRWHRVADVHFPVESTFLHGEPADFSFDVSLGYAGSQQIELIKPTRGHSIYSEYLANGGPGVHHLAWMPHDFDESLRRAVSGGFTVVQQASNGEVDYAYLETPGMGTPYVELVRASDRILAGFEALRGASGGDLRS